MEGITSDCMAVTHTSPSTPGSVETGQNEMAGSEASDPDGAYTEGTDLLSDQR